MAISPEQFAEHLSRIEKDAGIKYGPGTLRLPNGSTREAWHTAAVPVPGNREGGGLVIRSVVPGNYDMPHHIDAGDFGEEMGVGLEHSPLHYPRRNLPNESDLNMWSQGTPSSERYNGETLRAANPKDWANRATESMRTYSAARSTAHGTAGMLWAGGPQGVGEFMPGKKQDARDRRYMMAASSRTRSGLHIPVFDDDDFSGMLDQLEFPQQQDDFTSSSPSPLYNFDLKSR